MSEAQSVRVQRIGPAIGVLGAIGVIAVGAAYMTGDAGLRKSLLQSYHFAFIAWMSLTLGCFGLMLLHHTIRPRWGLPLIRIFEAGGGPASIVLMGLLFLPIALGIDQIFIWMDPHHVDDIIRSKQWVLNPGFFLGASAVLFLIWLFWATLLRTSSLREDESRDPTESQKRTNWAAPGIVMFILTCTLSSTLWIMSLEPHWYSTIFGFLYVVGAALAAMAFATIIFTSNAKRQPYANVVEKVMTRDHGNMLFALTMLWGYMTLSQFLIIWSANLPEEVPYYMARSTGGWNWLGLTIMLGQFFVPFLVLLAPRTKHTPRLLLFTAIGILTIRMLDYFWIVVPSLPERMESISVRPWDVIAFVGIGGLWLAVFAFQLGKARLFPTHDPRIREALEHA